jgi:adenylate cyclase
VLNVYWGIAAPLVTRRFGGEVEKFIGDGLVAVFNSRGDQPDHALRAAGAALALQSRLAEAAEHHPDWPRLRVGVNTGETVLREIGVTVSSRIRWWATRSTRAHGSRASRRKAEC